MSTRRLAPLAYAAAITVILESAAWAQTAQPDECAPYALSGGVLTCAASGSMREQLRTATFISGSAATGETLAQGLALEVATAPLGSSSGGFVWIDDTLSRFNPGGRASSMFGPSFSERALTIGRNKLSAGMSFTLRTYDTIEGLDLERLEVLRFVGGTLPVTASVMQIAARTSTTSVFGQYGVRDNLDVGLMVPFVTVSLSGVSRIYGDSGQELQTVSFDGSTAGIGDIAVVGKYRFLHVGPPAQAGADSNGDLAAMATLRLPSGDVDDMLGLGVTRLLLGLIGSASLGKVAPHVNVGYEFWSDSVGIPRDFQSDAAGIFVRDQIQFALGTEYEVSPRLTAIVDVLGRYQRGGGRVGYQPLFFPDNLFDVQGADALVGIPFGYSTVTLVPGVKWNFHERALLTGNVLVPVTDSGLRDRVTPVIGIDWGF
jgi:hypothetical protein